MMSCYGYHSENAAANYMIGRARRLGHQYSYERRKKGFRADLGTALETRDIQFVSN